MYYARLENINESEKKILLDKLRKKLLQQGLLYIPTALICFILLIQINYHHLLGTNETMRSIANVILAIVGVLLVRLFIGHTLMYIKERSAWQKKVIRASILSINKNQIAIGSEKIKVSPIELKSIRVNDMVEIGISTKSNMLIYIKKTQH
ncbi:MAG: hypothetical protein J0M08_08315 [Bacteroidetes bacterium]|nr:hypothetical protein [Bacteroidota bacterium]